VLDKRRLRARLVLPDGFDEGKRRFPMSEASSLASGARVVAACSAAFHDPMTHGSIGALYSGGRTYRLGYNGREAGRLVVLAGTGLRLDSPRATPGWQAEAAFVAGPTLVDGGVVHVDARGEGYTDPDILGSARRVALGSRSDDELVLATGGPMRLEALARLMLDAGCRTAVNLDGGCAAFLTAEVDGRRRTFASPSGRLPYILVFWKGD
jgi:exopolysaccharide biosynthesis protein